MQHAIDSCSGGCVNLPSNLYPYFLVMPRKRPQKNRPERHWGRNCLLALAAVDLLFSGCRTFSTRLPDSRQVRARQMSLRGADLLRRDRYEDAETLFNEALQSSPNDERAHWGLASTLWEKGEKETALVHMREAVRLSGSNPDYIVRLGQMYLTLGDVESAWLQAATTLKQNRDRADAWALLGDCQSRVARPDDALASYHRALLVQPDYPKVQMSVAELYRQLGRPQRTLATLDRFRDLHPTHELRGQASLVRGLALLDLDRPEEASIALKEASQHLDESQLERQLQLANSLFQLGDYVEARMALGKVLLQAPENQTARSLQSSIDSSFAQIAQESSGVGGPSHGLPFYSNDQGAPAIKIFR